MSASADEASENPAKKGSLRGVDEHFEPDSDAASPGAVVLQQAVKRSAMRILFDLLHTAVNLLSTLFRRNDHDPGSLAWPGVAT